MDNEIKYDLNKLSRRQYNFLKSHAFSKWKTMNFHEIPDDLKDLYALKWLSLDITNDFIFGKVLETKNFCKRVAEAFLDEEVEDVVIITQKAIKVAELSRGVRFDAYMKNSKRIVCIEMQFTNNYDIPVRVRSYVSHADMEAHKESETFKEMKEVYVIFICCFDFGQLGLPVYTWKLRAEEAPHLVLDDGVHRILYNATAPLSAMEKVLSPDACAFLALVGGHGIVNDNAFVKEIVQEIKIIKENSEYMGEYMRMSFEMKSYTNEILAQGIQQGVQQGVQQGIQQGIQQGVQQGIQQGVQLGSINTAKKLMQRSMSDIEIAEITELPLTTIRNLRK